jgi:heme peroxidase
MKSTRVLPWSIPGVDGPELAKRIKIYAEEQMLADSRPSNNVLVPAGYTYLGQLISHDLSFSSSGRTTIPRLDLGTVYGAGPETDGTRFTAMQGGVSSDGASVNSGYPGYFTIGQGVNPLEPDLPRDSQGIANIADSRNDVTVLLSQTTLMVMHAHNNILMHLARDPSRVTADEFNSARQTLVWFYHYLILTDYLQRLTGRAWLATHNARLHQRIEALPDYFVSAAFRVGHAMVRPNYLLNAEIARQHRRIPIFDRTGDDLRGRCSLPRLHSLQWDWFLDFESSFLHFPQKSRKFQPTFAPPLAHVPSEGRLVAEADLAAAVHAGLPNGQELLNYAGVDGNMSYTLADPSDPFAQHPLIYMLCEARDVANGYHLGPTASLLIGDTLQRVIYQDSDSFLQANPQWQPSDAPSLRATLGNKSTWRFADLVRVSGLPVTAVEINNRYIQGDA